ncbi:MAG: DUF962 domain-containing protein [Aureispira sp.]|nr:DUF962 domain-containing protein [Aureispira sp.]
MSTNASTPRKIDVLLSKYGESHVNPTNKAIHWICIPLIMFSLLGMLYTIPFPITKSLFANWAMVFLGLTLVYYLVLSIPIFLGFVVVGGAMAIGNHYLGLALGDNMLLLWVSIGIFFVAWVFQFIGHKIEGAKPSFLEDLQFLLIGPAWLLHFLYKKVGLKY